MAVKVNDLTELEFMFPGVVFIEYLVLNRDT